MTGKQNQQDEILIKVLNVSKHEKLEWFNFRKQTYFEMTHFTGDLKGNFDCVIFTLSTDFIASTTSMLLINIHFLLPTKYQYYSQKQSAQ